MKGKKRPGYRGDDAYGGGDSVAGGGDQGNVGGNRDAREIGARMSRTQAMARANQRAQAALGDPDPEVDVATKDRRDTITNFGKNLLCSNTVTFLFINNKYDIYYFTIVNSASIILLQI